jgi:uncharacterized membrane protein
MSTPNRSADQDRTDKSLGELIASLQADVSTLVTDQIALAKAELRDSARNAGAAAALIGAAAFLGVLMIIFLFVTLAYVLVQLGLTVWAGFGIVTLLLLVLTMILLLIARSKGNKVKGPERTQRSMTALSELRPGTPADTAPTVDVSA